MSGKPFLFDNNMFDDDALTKIIEEEQQAKPEFTRDELAAEKQKSYDEGKQAGFSESEAGITKASLAVLEKVSRDIAVLFEAEDERAKKYEEETIHLTLKIIQKLFPLYMEKYGEEEIKSAIKTALCTHNTPEKVRIEIQEDLLLSIEKYIKEMENSLNKRITLVSNESLSKNECKISWPNGGIICNHNAIAEKTFSIIKETLAERGISVHDDKNGEDKSNKFSGNIKKGNNDDVIGET